VKLENIGSSITSCKVKLSDFVWLATIVSPSIKFVF